MTDPRQLRPGELPPIPEGCGLLPMAENRIARVPGPELVAPEGLPPLEGEEPSPGDVLEPAYRRVLARALALAAASLLLSAAVMASLADPVADAPAGAHPLFSGTPVLNLFFAVHVLFLGLCGRYLVKLTSAPAALLLVAYSALSALWFSFLIPPRLLAPAFLSAGLMYAVAALWGFLRGCDLAHPVTPVLMILLGGAILFLVNRIAETPKVAWGISSIAVVVFAGLAGHFAQPIRDLYQDFDDDNASGWKASVLGSLLLVLNLVNIFLFCSAALSRSVRTLDEEI